MVVQVLLLARKKKEKKEPNKTFVKELQSSFLNRYAIPADGIYWRNCCILVGRRRYNFLQRLAQKPADPPV